MSTEGKLLNRRTFNQVVEAVLKDIELEINQEINKALKKATFFTKADSSRARDYEAQADGLIDAQTIIGMKLLAVKNGVPL